MTHDFSIEFCGNLEACRTEARISSPSAKPDTALVALVYETTRGFVVSYFGAALSNRSRSLYFRAFIAWRFCDALL